MIRFLTAVLMLASLTVRADTQVPHTFEDGEVISATEFNQNFDTLESAIDDIPAGATGAQGPQGEQGPAGADPFAGLNCEVGDQLRMGSSGWECRAEPITASLMQDSWQNQGAAYIGKHFDHITNVDTNSYWSGGTFFISVIGVVNHSSCTVEITGDAASSGSAVMTEPSQISIGVSWVYSQSVYINISCTP